MPAILELHLTCAKGKEVECAKHLASQLRGEHWEILSALAAELVHEHEIRHDGSAVVVIAVGVTMAVTADKRYSFVTEWIYMGCIAASFVAALAIRILQGDGHDDRR